MLGREGEGGQDVRLTREALAARATALAAESEAAAGAADSARLAGLLDAAVTQLLAAGTISAGEAPPAAPAARGAPEATMAAPPPFAPLAGPEPGPEPSAGEALRAPRVRLYEPPPPPAPVAPVVPAGGAGGLLGLSGLVRAEAALAARLLTLALRPGPATERAGAWLAADQEAQALSAEQRAAVGVATGSGLFVLTGGPGVGKTTTLRVLVRCLRAGGYADVVVFDYQELADGSTIEQPLAYCRGVEHVLVNGTAVVADGEHTGARPGRALRRR